MRRQPSRAPRSDGEGGFTLVELMITVALLGTAISYITLTLMNGWRLWRSAYYDLQIQHNARIAMERIVQGIRHARPGTVTIDSVPGEPNFSRIQFTHVREQPWAIWQQGGKLYVAAQGATSFLADAVTALQFTYPSFADVYIIDVGLTLTQRVYEGKFVRTQLTQRVHLRNP